MLHGIYIKDCTPDELHIDFSIEEFTSDKDARTKAQESLHTVLIMLGLTLGDEKNKKDYRFVKSPDNNLPPTDLYVYGKINIIVVLEFLLENPIREKLYRIKDYPYVNNVKAYWKEKLDGLYVQCINDPAIYKGDYEKIIPHIKSFLDCKFKELSGETLVIALPNKAQINSGDNLLKHPLYQTLSLLLTDYDNRKEAHIKSEGFIKSKHPSGTEYNKVISKFLPFIPTAYRGDGHIGSKKIAIDNEKIKKSREELPQALQLMPNVAAASIPFTSSMTKK